MFIPITNTPRDYAWGSTTAIADLLGTTPSGRPEAELWLGAHPADPSRVVGTDHGAGDVTLDRLIAADPTAALGAGRTRLPFLLKVLASEAPLSLQVHPDTAQAEAGFDAEERAGVPIDSPERNYRDRSAKPEIILALSETFEALAGFRVVSESRMLFNELAASAQGDDRSTIRRFAERLGGDRGADAGGQTLKDAVSALLTGGEESREVVAAVVRAATGMRVGSSYGREWETIATLAEDYPGDPGIVISLLLNRISLRQGQALALPAGNMHAYLSGLGVELMSASDNVLRGGLTTKHVDVAELLRIAVFQPLPVPLIHSDSPAAGIDVFRADVDDFVLAQITLGDAGYVHGYQMTGPESAAFTLTGPAIALAVAGSVRITGLKGDATVGRGGAVFISPDEAGLEFAGSGQLFVATTP